MKKSQLAYLILIAFITLSLLIIHTFPFFKIDIIIDNTSLLLIIILIILPFIPNLKRIKWGEFEAEIGTNEIRKLEESVKRIKPIERKTDMKFDGEKVIGYNKEELKELGIHLFSLAEYDPIIALVELRSELEKITQCAYEIFYKKEGKNRFFNTYQMASELMKKGIITNDTLISTNEVLKICNKVIHGQEIKPKTAQHVVSLGLEILAALHGYTLGYTIGSALGDYLLSPSNNNKK